MNPIELEDTQHPTELEDLIYQLFETMKYAEDRISTIDRLLKKDGITETEIQYLNIEKEQIEKELEIVENDVHLCQHTLRIDKECEMNEECARGSYDSHDEVSTDKYY